MSQKSTGEKSAIAVGTPISPTTKCVTKESVAFESAQRPAIGIPTQNTMHAIPSTTSTNAAAKRRPAVV